MAEDAKTSPPPEPEPWTFEGASLRQLRAGLAMTPAERLRWLEEAVEELGPWVGRALTRRPKGTDP